MNSLSFLITLMMFLVTNCVARTVMDQAKVNNGLQRSINLSLHFCDPNCFDYYCDRFGVDCRDSFDACARDCRFNDYFCLDNCAAECGC